MRRFALSVTALLALACAATAGAADHQMTVNEVATSLGGSNANQYVELRDPADEPFLAVGGYRLVSYDGAGVSMGEQSLGGGMGIVDGGTPMLIGKGSVGAAPDQALTVSLQTPNGQACFQRNDGSIIHCMRWGTITNPVGFSASSGPSPPDGQALQGCPAGAVPGPPTPKAANSCNGGTGGGGGGTTDTTKPRAALTTARQKLGPVLASGYKLKVKSNEKGRARAQLVRKGRILRTVTKSVSAGVAKSFTLTVPRATKLALAKASSATFSVKVRLTDAAGNVRNVTRPVTVKR